MNLKELFEYAVYHISEIYSLGEAKQIVNILFEDLWGIKIFSENQFLDYDQKNQLDQAIKRLKEGEPVQYITEKSFFYGLEFKVNHHVLIPRPETEELVNWILEDTKGNYRQMEVLDIGTGSGCIAITLKKMRPFFRTFGIEFDLDAYNVTRINARKLNVAIQLERLDILEEEAWSCLGKFDIIVSNPPYIPEAEKVLMEKNVLDYEPTLALFVKDADPLIFYRKIVKFGQAHLNEGGCIYVEINEFNKMEVESLFIKSGFDNIVSKRDMQGKWRMMKVTEGKAGLN